MFLFLASGALALEERTYVQFKTVAAQENGKVIQSTKVGDLFEYTYSIDIPKQKIIRTKIRRLDKKTGEKDSTVYDIAQRKKLFGSQAGNGGRVIVAVSKDGSEIIELSHRFAFTLRISPFSQVITGMYKRAFTMDRVKDFDKDRGWKK